MILCSKKGAALLQVLLVTAVLAGIATMLLRASLSRTSAVHQVKRTMTAEMLVESCMAEVNSYWAGKSSAAFARDMNACIMRCTESGIPVTCPEDKKRREYTGTPSFKNTQYTVTATISGSEGACEIKYEVNGADNL